MYQLPLSLPSSDFESRARPWIPNHNHHLCHQQRTKGCYAAGMNRPKLSSMNLDGSQISAIRRPQSWWMWHHLVSSQLLIWIQFKLQQNSWRWNIAGIWTIVWIRSRVPIPDWNRCGSGSQRQCHRKQHQLVHFKVKTCWNQFKVSIKQKKQKHDWQLDRCHNNTSSHLKALAPKKSYWYFRSKIWGNIYVIWRSGFWFFKIFCFNPSRPEREQDAVFVILPLL